MSKLDKEKVLAEYTEAYEKAHGKKPKIEASNGWYSVDGGKNVRLAQLDEEAKALAKGKPAKAEKASDKKAAAKKTETKSDTKKAAPKKTAAKKEAPKKAAAKKPAVKKSNSGGLTAKELWKQKLESKGTDCRLPRGSA
ncbi:hypothetical protein [Idiomarina zobellii]|jgi:predicted Zn-dependent protease|uniref:Uncharacterized protein n=1 Tax=Idiomarina zobellii TaxID=86103 RepID=A0A837N9Q5_9GAMM|nr:hypothetical protein [Idiomarina zobellii]KPD23644.1 hypothetical protein AFK76_08230 [Idiomarina zobellii]SDF91498.1 hypothetical protein SAMN04515658_10724 [Idiomarina zobellii]